MAPQWPPWAPARKKRWGNDAIGVDANSAWNLPATARDLVWFYDFVAAMTSNGGPLRMLNVVDEFTHGCVGVQVARSIGARDVARFLKRVIAKLGAPSLLRSENGREFTADVPRLGQRLRHRAGDRGRGQATTELLRRALQQHDARPAPQRRAVTLRHRVVLAAWVELYNTVRPYRALGMKSPARYASEWHKATVRRDGRSVSASNGSRKGANERGYDHSTWTKDLSVL